VIRTVAKRGYRVVADVEAGAFYKGVEIPADDAARVAALRTYGILDTAPEVADNDITAMAARISDRFSLCQLLRNPPPGAVC
jgi:DNA-binding winged helix-turn-helix (wHTH) protein